MQNCVDNPLPFLLKAQLFLSELTSGADVLSISDEQLPFLLRGLAQLDAKPIEDETIQFHQRNPQFNSRSTCGNEIVLPFNVIKNHIRVAQVPLTILIEHLHLNPDVRTDENRAEWKEWGYFAIGKEKQKRSYVSLFCVLNKMILNVQAMKLYESSSTDESNNQATVVSRKRKRHCGCSPSTMKLITEQPEPPFRMNLSRLRYIDQYVRNGVFWSVGLGVLDYKRYVGLKYVNTVDTTFHDLSVKMLCNEITILKDLVVDCHPNIVTAIGYVIDSDEHPCLVLEHATYGTLDSIVSEHTVFPNIPFAVQLLWIFDIAKGLSFLHNKPLIHMSMNPYNIYIVDGIHAKISNFTLSIPNKTVVKHLASQYTPKEHREYVSPEILDNRTISLVSDVYSFALICCYVLLRQHPILPSTDLIADVVHRHDITQYEQRLIGIIVKCSELLMKDRLRSESIVQQLSELVDNVSGGNGVDIDIELFAHEVQRYYDDVDDDEYCDSTGSNGGTGSTGSSGQISGDISSLTSLDHDHVTLIESIGRLCIDNVTNSNVKRIPFSPYLACTKNSEYIGHGSCGEIRRLKEYNQPMICMKFVKIKPNLLLQTNTDDNNTNNYHQQRINNMMLEIEKLSKFQQKERNHIVEMYQYFCPTTTATDSGGTAVTAGEMESYGSATIHSLSYIGYTMEFAEYGTLQHLLICWAEQQLPNDFPSMSWELMLHGMQDVAAGLSHLHSLKENHKGLGPANVFAFRDQKKYPILKLGDFNMVPIDESVSADMILQERIQEDMMCYAKLVGIYLNGGQAWPEITDDMSYETIKARLMKWMECSYFKFEYKIEVLITDIMCRIFASKNERSPCPSAKDMYDLIENIIQSGLPVGFPKNTIDVTTL